MATVEEVLKASGMTDEQIKALDAKILSGFNGVLTTATASEQAAAKAREDAELAKRAQDDLYNTKIAPALDNWAVDSANLKAERDFYRTQAQEAKSGGFVPTEAPGYKPPVANANPVPGSPSSPQYLTANDGLKAVSNVTWVMSEHQRLFGQPMPDDFESLVNEANANHRQFRDHVAMKYGFDKKRQEMAAAKAQAEKDAIIKETEARVNKEWSERTGNNPMVRTPQQSQFADIRKGVDAQQRKDPLTMSREQRRESTRQNIQKEIAAGPDRGGATVN